MRTTSRGMEVSSSKVIGAVNQVNAAIADANRLAGEIRKAGGLATDLTAHTAASAAARDWFQKARAGEVYVSAPYISAISQRPCLTVSLPIIDDGETVGIIGANLRLATV